MSKRRSRGNSFLRAKLLVAELDQRINPSSVFDQFNELMSYASNHVTGFVQGQNSYTNWSTYQTQDLLERYHNLYDQIIESHAKLDSLSKEMILQMTSIIDLRNQLANSSNMQTIMMLRQQEDREVSNFNRNAVEYNQAGLLYNRIVVSVLEISVVLQKRFVDGQVTLNEIQSILVRDLTKDKFYLKSFQPVDLIPRTVS